MSEEQQFAAVMAQVIPVVILALVVEARAEHQVRIARTIGTPRSNKWGLLVQAAVMPILTFVEVAALLTAHGKPPAWIRQVAGIPGVITVGILLIVLGQIYIWSLVDAYGNKSSNPNWVKGFAVGLVLAAIIGGVFGVAYP
ncbi:hypothetical protein ACWCO0_35460 [Streptomyces tubercidicus]